MLRRLKENSYATLGPWTRCGDLQRQSLSGAAALCLCLVFGVVMATQQDGESSASATTADPPGGTGSFLLTATNTGPTYAPTFTGNGELGVRVPPHGQGYEGGAVPPSRNWRASTLSPRARAAAGQHPDLVDPDVLRGGQAFTLAGGNPRWRQSINLRTGVVATQRMWTAPDGRVTDLSYQVLTDRARPDVGLVRLEMTPRWSGTATITDVIDGSPATLSTQLEKGWSLSNRRDWVSVQTVGTKITAAIVSQLSTSANVRGRMIPVDQSVDQSVGQQLGLHSRRRP